MTKEKDELTLFISYLQNERHYSSKTITSYETDLLEVKKFLKDNGGYTVGKTLQNVIFRYICNTCLIES